MPNEQTAFDAILIELTTDIVSAYVANNAVQASTLPELIASVHSAVVGLTSASGDTLRMPIPAVDPKRSVFPDYLVCLDDGKHFRSMKRHLAKLGMTPAEYRTKWGLPANYPMVAPNYGAARSELAKKSGLGRAPVAGAGRHRTTH